MKFFEIDRLILSILSSDIEIRYGKPLLCDNVTLMSVNILNSLHKLEYKIKNYRR